MRNKLPDDFRQPCHKALLYVNTNDKRMIVHLPWAETQSVKLMWLRRRQSVTAPQKLPKLGLPVDWQQRTQKFMQHRVVEEVRYSSSQGLEYTLPYTENSNLPGLFRKFRRLWNDGSSPQLELGCHFHYDSSRSWMTLSMCSPLLFSERESWRDVHLNSNAPMALEGLAGTGQAFIRRLFSDGRIRQAYLYTPFTQHLCHVAIGVQPGGQSLAEAAVSEAMEEALGLSLIYAT